MTGSPTFSINLTNRKNPPKRPKLSNHMSIKKSQAILKLLIRISSLAFSNTLGSENETMFCDTYARFKCRTLHAPNLIPAIPSVGRPTLLSSTVDSDGKTLHVSNLIISVSKTLTGSRA